MRCSPWLLAISLLGAPVGQAQLASHDGAPIAQNTAPPHRQRLILKDGSFQIVMSYKVVGNRVQYVSAERGGEMEEIPLELVDLDATRKYEQRHTIRADNPTPDAPDHPPVLDPELAKEEADRAALTPEVAPDLRLVPQDSVLALDTYQGAPELVPLMQTEGDLNKETGHSVLRGIVKPRASPHQLVTIPGEAAAVQMHVALPEFYLRLDDALPPGGDAITVDTGGASSSPALKEKKTTGQSRYAIVRVDVRQGARVVTSFDTSATETTKRQEDLVATTMTPMAGGHWAKLTPVEPLLFGEYALVEILADNQINLSVWDFGVHPTAPENRDVLHPEKRRPAALESRPKE
jgi:hypothetical protein